MLSGLFLLAIVVGSVIGLIAPAAGGVLADGVDPLILLLVGLLLFGVRLPQLSRVPPTPGDGRSASQVLRTAATAVAVNFLVVPCVAAGLAVLLVPDGDIRLGLFIYCLFPCTDWFLGFTRLALGDTVAGAVLIPVQLVLQLLLYPVWVGWFSSLTGDSSGVGSPVEWSLPVSVFVVPATAGFGAQLLCRRLLPPAWDIALTRAVDRLVPIVIAAVIICLFSANVGVVVDNPAAFGTVLLAAFMFFVVLYFCGEVVSRVLRMDRPATTLLIMTTSARNAPLMIALTAVFLPDRPEVLTAIVLGMLIEFPHLTVISHLRRQRSGPVGTPSCVMTVPAVSR